jgi:NTP pyrophosphatase (non-canonical NTP hydrolase)
LLEIRADSVFEHGGFANINDLTSGILHKIDTWLFGQLFELGFDVFRLGHTFILSLNGGINTSMATEPDSLASLMSMIITYRDERDWAQFHSLKNSATNVIVEAAELLDHFRYQDEADDFDAVKEEAADVLYALLIFAHDAKINLGEEVIAKLAKNALKYPVEKAKGRASKYTAYQDKKS